MGHLTWWPLFGAAISLAVLGPAFFWHWLQHFSHPRLAMITDLATTAALACLGLAGIGALLERFP